MQSECDLAIMTFSAKERTEVERGNNRSTPLCAVPQEGLVLCRSSRRTIDMRRDKHSRIKDQTADTYCDHERTEEPGTANSLLFQDTACMTAIRFSMRFARLSSV